MTVYTFILLTTYVGICVGMDTYSARSEVVAMNSSLLGA
jgi:hypothetical protein